MNTSRQWYSGVIRDAGCCLSHQASDEPALKPVRLRRCGSFLCFFSFFIRGPVFLPFVATCLLSDGGCSCCCRPAFHTAGEGLVRHRLCLLGGHDERVQRRGGREEGRRQGGERGGSLRRSRFSNGRLLRLIRAGFFFARAPLKLIEVRMRPRVRARGCHENARRALVIQAPCGCRWPRRRSDGTFLGTSEGELRSLLVSSARFLSPQTRVVGLGAPCMWHVTWGHGDTRWRRRYSSITWLLFVSQ